MVDIARQCFQAGRLLGDSGIHLNSKERKKAIAKFRALVSRLLAAPVDMALLTKHLNGWQTLKYPGPEQNPLLAVHEIVRRCMLHIGQELQEAMCAALMTEVFKNGRPLLTPKCETRTVRVVEDPQRIRGEIWQRGTTVTSAVPVEFVPWVPKLQRKMVQ